MLEFELPYDKRTMTLHLEERNFAGELVGRQSGYPAAEDPAALVEADKEKLQKANERMGHIRDSIQALG